MSDTLRTRIAAAIYDGMNEWDRKYAIDPRNSALTPELKAEITCFKLADAVIRELNLDISHTYKTSQGREVCIEGFWTEEATDGTA